MPTRIVLKETTPPSRMAVPNHSDRDDNLALSREDEIHLQQLARGFGTGSAFSTPPRGSRTNRVGSNSHRKVVGFRSSILRDLSSRNLQDEGEYDETGEERRKQLHLSNQDIRASPRLLGYLFGWIASAVMLVSVIQFYLQEDKLSKSDVAALNSYNRTVFPEDEFFLTINGPVYLWKLWGAFGVALGGTCIFLIILLMHFDTICFPRLWFQFFRDGSLAERNLLLALLVFWAASLHVTTSSLSVGEAQANVFFTTWIAFVCTAMNYGVWRESAGLPRLADKIIMHHRETTYNWCWTLIFVLVTAGAATDMYFNREQITLRLKGEILVLNKQNWMQILALVWSEVLLCIVALFLNHFWTRSCKFNCGGCRLVLNWRFLEGLLIICQVGFKFWIILEYTGVDGVITGLNNAYFGVWGAFFNAVFTFGTWLRENKDIDYII